MPTRQSFKNLSTKFIEETFADFTQTWELQRLLELPDNQGGYTTNWAKLTDVTGFVSPMDGKEVLKDDQLNTEQMVKFQFKYIDEIDESMRIFYEGDYYNIRSIRSSVGVDIWHIVIAEKAVAT